MDSRLGYIKGEDSQSGYVGFGCQGSFVVLVESFQICFLMECLSCFCIDIGLKIETVLLA